VIGIDEMGAVQFGQAFCLVLKCPRIEQAFGSFEPRQCPSCNARRFTVPCEQGEFAMPVASRRKTPVRELKKDRLELRVAASAKALIQRAMAVSGLTAGDLAYEGARRVLDEHERMVLTGANRDAFLDAVLNPPKPTDRLVKALRRHRDVVG
jgi:uncharacterized protein (DUF1778 family)